MDTSMTKTPLESRAIWGGTLLFLILLWSLRWSQDPEAGFLDQLWAIKEQIAGLLSWLLVVIGRTKASVGIRWPWQK